MSKTIDERLAELDAQHQKDREEIERERGIVTTLARMGLPLPERVGFYSRGEPWLNYKVGSAYASLGEPGTLAQALDVVRAFGPYLQGVTCVKSGCTSVQPPALQAKEYRDKEPAWVVDDCVEVCFEAGQGYGSCELSAHVVVPELGPLRVRVSLEPSPAHKFVRSDRHRGFRKEWVVTRYYLDAAVKPDAVITWGGMERDSEGGLKGYRISAYFQGVPTEDLKRAGE